MKSKILGLLAVGLMAGPMVANALVVYTSDFIADGTRSNFVGFEGLPATGTYGNTHTEDGVTVTQVNGNPNGISTVCGGGCWATNSSGRSWYANGGDFGWTQITRADASDFDSVGMLLGSGYGGNNSYYVLWELLNNGTSIASGTLALVRDQYLGFGGGGFDLIRIRNTTSVGGVFGDGRQNALALDNIELALVPEPGTLALLGLGLLGLGVTRRKA